MNLPGLFSLAGSPKSLGSGRRHFSKFSGWAAFALWHSGEEKLDEILKKGRWSEGRKGAAEQSWRPPKKWTHSSCVQKWDGGAAALVARSVR